MDLSVEDPEPQMRLLLSLAQYENVRVKVSELTSVTGMTYPFRDAYPYVKRVYEAFGPDRLLWGTGYPGAARGAYKRPTLKQELALIREGFPFLNHEARDKMLGGNAALLWGL
jgi:predicted TIM-barrel fold metal-dependent hydrolase